jgi:aspartyl-tRNA(Asn)/glutamyl-tRNA(Gln) amidotransferase subunit B
MGGGYTPTIGLEIHAELKTVTKMFCASRNDPDAAPNTHICPVCMAHPGTLPVVNHEAVRQVLRVGTALSGTLADYTEFDRKNYFYPDLPKGYQISQYEYPLVKGGTLAGVAITRVHLEEDTATSKHDGAQSVVDFNRAGVPLMELVTEPVIHDALTASRFAKELQLLLRTLGAGEANMEKGQMRVEANISVSRDRTLGTKTEVKNLNSFKSVERAIEFEIKRQVEVLESGGTLVQETRGFDEDRGVTFSQRLKESSHDYRYFPDPDIPKFQISCIPDFAHEALKASLPELPDTRRARYASLGIRPQDVETLVADTLFQEFFDSELAGLGPKLVPLSVNYLLTDIRGTLSEEGQLDAFRGGRLAKVMTMVESDSLSSRGAKDLLALLSESDEEPQAIAESKGLLQKSDSDFLSRIAEKVIQDNTKVVEEIRAGKRDAIKFLVGVGMRESKGQANPAELLKSIEAALG